MHLSIFIRYNFEFIHRTVVLGIYTSDNIEERWQTKTKSTFPPIIINWIPSDIPYYRSRDYSFYLFFSNPCVTQQYITQYRSLLTEWKKHTRVCYTYTSTHFSPLGCRSLSQHRWMCFYVVQNITRYVILRKTKLFCNLSRSIV